MFNPLGVPGRLLFEEKPETLVLFERSPLFLQRRHFYTAASSDGFDALRTPSNRGHASGGSTAHLPIHMLSPMRRLHMEF